MGSSNNVPPSTSFDHDRPPHLDCRSLPPADAPGTQHVLSSYPSSTMHYYYPSSHHVANYAHISTFPQPFSSNPPVGGEFGPLPSVSQSHLPSIRRTPLVPVHNNIDVLHASQSPYYDQRHNNVSCSSQRIHSISPIAFHQPQSVPVFAPQPIRFPPATPFHHQLPAPIVPTANNNNTHLSSFNSSLPSTKDVPLLSGKHDWAPWHSAVRALIINANLLGHIADDPLPGASFDPGLWPTYPPTVHPRSKQDKIRSFTEWWTCDGLASHILTSRVAPSVLGCLPIANERMGHRRSSRTVYATLRHQFGAVDYSAVMLIEARLRQLRCLPTRGGVRVTDFIATWRTSVNQMDAAGFLPGPRQLLTIFADGLPHHTVTFINLYDSILSWLNEPNERLLPSIHFLFDRTVNIDNNIQRNRIMHPGSRRPLPGVPSSPAHSIPTSAIPALSPPLVTPLTTRSTRSRCSNCGREGHTDDTCFQPGGAMEGRREEFLASRAPRPVAHIAEVEETIPDGEEGAVVVDESTLNTEFAALSINTTNDIIFSTYVLSSISEISKPLAQPFAFSSISQEYNAALDSACTNHIFHDRSLFHTYDIDGAVPVKTANFGFLTTLAVGDIKIKLTFGDKTVTWTLWNCLHAPDVPINLISVGALQEHHMSVVFSFQKTTICFPSDHPQLSGLSFDVHVTQRLSLLRLVFVPPPDLPVALQLFPVTQPSPDVWHRHFGHLGHEASKNVLNGNYATGIVKPPTPYPSSSRCIPCLIGKSPQAPYSNNAKWATSICELVHVDICGPFPTLTPKKEAYFIIFLDDASNYSVASLLSTKNGAFPAWKKTEASWELISGNRIRTVRLDGANAHAQAGKAERYVHT